MKTIMKLIPIVIIGLSFFGVVLAPDIDLRKLPFVDTVYNEVFPQKERAIQEIDPNEWFLGESINTTTNFPDEFIFYDYIRQETENIGLHFMDGEVSSPVYRICYKEKEDKADSVVITLTWNMWAGNSGTIKSRWRLLWQPESAYLYSPLLMGLYIMDTHSWDATCFGDAIHYGIDFPSGTDAVWKTTNGGHWQMEFQEEYKVTQDHISADNMIQFELQVYHQGSGIDFDVNLRRAEAYFGRYSIMLEKLQMRYFPDPITEFIRSFYHYPSVSNPSIVEHKIEVYAPFKSDITLNLPLDWSNNAEGITVNPQCELEFDSVTNDVTLKNTIQGTTYTLLIQQNPDLSSYSPSYSKPLSVRDISEDYLENIGFEDGYSELLDDTSYLAPDFSSLNNSIVSEGSNSYRFGSNGGWKLLALGGTSVNEHLLDEGYYVFSIDTYIEKLEDSDTYFRLRWNDGGANKYYYFHNQYTTPNLHRWERHFFDVHIGNTFSDSGNTYQMRFELFDIGGNMKAIIFLDNLRIYRSSTSINSLSTGINTYEVYSQFIELDNYKNEFIPNAEATIEIYRRRGNLLLATFQGVTNAEGIFRTTWKYSLELWEYDVRAYIDISYSSSSFITPQIVGTSDFALNYNLGSLGGWDFQEETPNGLSSNSGGSGTTITASNGLWVGIGNSDGGVKFNTDFQVDLSYYDTISLMIYSDEDIGFQIETYSSSWITLMPQIDIDKNSWQIITFPHSLTGVYTNLRLYFERFISTTIYIDWIRLYHSSEISINQNQDYFVASSEFDSLLYQTSIDTLHIGNYYDLETVWKDTSSGLHYYNFTAYYDSFNIGCYINSTSIIGSYLNNVSGQMKIIIHDQRGRIIPFDSLKTYIDGIRLYDQFYFTEDISQLFNLTITDLFDNLLHTNPSEAFENFKEIQIELYSVKLINMDTTPVYLDITRSSQTFSEWVLPREIVEYYLPTAIYTFQIEYSSIDGDLSSASLNDTRIAFTYEVVNATAIFISGLTIEDVFSNIINLAEDLSSVNDTLGVVNASLHTQIIDVSLGVENVNSSITNQIVNVDISLNNVNSTISQELLNINSQITNLESNISLEIFNINASISNIQSEILESTLNLTIGLSYLNSTVFNNTLSLLLALETTNSIVYNNTIEVLNNVKNVNSTIYGQTIKTLTSISNINSTLYDSTIEILSNILLTNSSLFNSSISILNSIDIVNSTVIEAKIEMLNEIAKLGGLYRLHFDLIDQLGIGLSWETFKVYVNDSRIYNQDQNYYNKTLIKITVKDYFETDLLEFNHNITKAEDIPLIVPLYWIILKNEKDKTSYVEIIRNGKLGLDLAIESNSSVIIRLTSGNYDFRVYYYEYEEQVSGFDNENANYGRKLSFTGSFKVTAKMTPSVVDVSAYDGVMEDGEPKDNWDIFKEKFFEGFSYGSLAGILATTLVVIAIKELWYGTKAVGLNKAPDDSIVTPQIIEKKQDLLNKQQHSRQYQKKQKEPFKRSKL